jgi:hypothetical protein
MKLAFSNVRERRKKVEIGWANVVGRTKISL